MWDSLLEYFSTLEQRPIQRLAFIVGSLLILWIIEGAIPLLPLKYKKNKTRHAAVNIFFTVLHLVIHTGFGVLIVLLCTWAENQQFGLVYWLNASVVGKIIIAALLLDFFGGWLSHLVEHKVPLFWRMHIIHHADNNVDVTSGLRHHPLESVWRGLFFLVAIVISGAPIYAVMIYQTLLTIFTGITHANISLPKPVDKIASYILVSPNMHKVHHHWKQPYTDSNYGAVFSIWDRLFGTYRTLDPKELRYGLDRYYPNEKDEDLVALLKKTFSKIRWLIASFNSMSAKSFIAVIPARYAATRFPGKLMQMLGEKTIIRHVYENTVGTNLFNDVFVVTDSEIIYKEIANNGGKAIMSQKEHESGSDRIAEAVADMPVDVIVNVQGDEPFIKREPLEKLVQLFDDERVQVASLMRKISKEHAHDPNNVKVVTDASGYALYFSRSVVPFQRDATYVPGYFLHIGVYAFKKSALMNFTSWPQSALEKAEKLEQLRYLENGIKIKMAETDYHNIAIDTPGDLEKAKTLL